MNKTKISFQKHLLRLVQKIAREEGFETKPLKGNYLKYYILSTKNGHRCVDGRSVLEFYEDGGQTGYNRFAENPGIHARDECQERLEIFPGDRKVKARNHRVFCRAHVNLKKKTPAFQAGEVYKNVDYRGDQFPGGTFGIIGATRVVTGLDETKTRAMVKSVCDRNGIRMGNHIDDAHGTIKKKEELEKRTRGCGNQDAAADGRIPMYAGLVDRAMVDDRFAWLKASGGAVPVLTGNHEEKLAAINLKTGKTFNTSKAVVRAESIFNADLAGACEFAGEIFEMLATQGDEHQGPVEKEDFQKAMIRAVVRDYMQTLVVLDSGREIFIHADPEVEI